MAEKMGAQAAAGNPAAARSSSCRAPCTQAAAQAGAG
jgi:hypothetical protein